MDKTDVLFPVAFRGYARRAVNEFILKMNGDFTGECEALKRRFASLNEELSELDEENARLNGELKSLREENRAISDEIKKLREEDRTSSDEVKSLSEKNETNENEIKKLGEEIALLSAERDALLGKNDALRASSADKDEKISFLIKDLSEYETKISEMTDSHDRDEKKIAEMEARLGAQSETNNALSERLREMADQIESLRAENEKFTEKYPAETEAYLNAVKDRMSSILREHVKKCLREILSGVDSMRSDADRISESANERAEKMTKSIDEFDNEMKNEVRAILNELKQ